MWNTKREATFERTEQINKKGTKKIFLKWQDKKNVIISLKKGIKAANGQQKANTASNYLPVSVGKAVHVPTASATKKKKIFTNIK